MVPPEDVFSGGHHQEIENAKWDTTLSGQQQYTHLGDLQ